MALLGLAALLAAGLLVAVFAFLGRPRAIDPNRLRVAIRPPSSGAHISAQDSVTVLEHASGPGPVTRYGLWADCNREHIVLPESGQAGLPLSIQISWRPLEPGPQILMARAFDTQGRAARSHPIVLEADSARRGDRVDMGVVLQPANRLESLSATFGPLPASDLPAGFVGDD